MPVDPWCPSGEDVDVVRAFLRGPLCATAPGSARWLPALREVLVTHIEDGFVHLAFVGWPAHAARAVADQLLHPDALQATEADLAGAFAPAFEGFGWDGLPPQEVLTRRGRPGRAPLAGGGAVEVSRESWPPRGLTGVCTRLQYAGCLVFAYTETRADWWTIFIDSPPDGEFELVVDSTQDMRRLASEWGVHWMPEGEVEQGVERRRFDVRSTLTGARPRLAERVRETLAGWARRPGAGGGDGAGGAGAAAPQSAQGGGRRG